jgi:hypothetical protein
MKSELVGILFRYNYILFQDDNKIALSMKVVNQGNGTDLDPKGVQIQ